MTYLYRLDDLGACIDSRTFPKAIPADAVAVFGEALLDHFPAEAKLRAALTEECPTCLGKGSVGIIGTYRCGMCGPDGPLRGRVWQEWFARWMRELSSGTAIEMIVASLLAAAEGEAE